MKRFKSVTLDQKEDNFECIIEELNKKIEDLDCRLKEVERLSHSEDQLSYTATKNINTLIKGMIRNLNVQIHSLGFRQPDELELKFGGSTISSALIKYIK